MTSEDTKILKFNQYQEYSKATPIIYEEPACLIKKVHECKNNLENSSTTMQVNILHQVFECMQYHHLNP